MSQVDFDFPQLCTAHRIDERAVTAALKAILTVGESPCSVEALSEIAHYSPRHIHRALKVLRFSSSHIAPVVIAQGGKRGKAYHFAVIFDRVNELGLLRNAA